MTHDRVATDQFALTQEFLAEMLGVRRASANQAAVTLQKRRAITYSRGKISVVNRRSLEKLSCQCYRSVKDEFDRLLPPLSTDAK